MTTVANEILDFLRQKPGARVIEIAEGIHKREGHVSVVLANMKKQGFVEQPHYGRYVVSNKHAKLNDLTESIHKDTQRFNIQKVALNGFDLENFDNILQLKEKYGKDKLVKILKKLIKVLE